MKKVYKLEGLDCAHCAGKIEEKIKKIDGLKSVVVNFMTAKMTLEADDDKFDTVFTEAKKIVNEFEPDVNVVKA
ncbi:cation transporter [Fusobacterium gastrosuis]|uniref:cation transporter n=1 Tax=Fusobacterium gastrosuis TaxID=1755100 RepID=UPI0029725891|nr:cation transporter [Fusobacteriaceae bacterium]MDY5305948.1 cation transporter [Fusobacterium gastrosuis]MDY5713042.1 cation transporter [Fusobacterium gastrosuis]